MHNDERAIGHNGKPATTPELSPRSIPHSSHEQPGQRTIHAAEPYNPFASAERTASEGSIYSPPGLAAERLDDGEVRFGNVDWKITRPEPTRTRTISNLQEVKLDGLPSTQKPPKPPFYRPVDSPPSHSSSPPAAKPGLGYKPDGDHWSSMDEKIPTGITTPPLTYYTPNRQENFRTNLDEKHGDDLSRHSSDLQPFPEFEDVELARPKPRGFAPGAGPVPMQAVRARYERRSAVCAWLVLALILLVPLGIALGVFGGVYHWNIRDERCSMWGGSWNQSTNSCQYR